MAQLLSAEALRSGPGASPKTVWPWVRYPTSPCCSALLCKTGMKLHRAALRAGRESAPVPHP